MRSIFDNAVVKKAVFDPAVSGASGTPQGTSVFVVDTFGFNTGMFEVFSGTPTGTTVTYTVSAEITECATSGGVYTSTGKTGTVTGFGTALAEHCQIRVESLGTTRLRYLKLSVVAVTNPTNKVIPVTAVAFLGRGFVEKGTANSATGTAAA